MDLDILECLNCSWNFEWFVAANETGFSTVFQRKKTGVLHEAKMESILDEEMARMERQNSVETFLWQRSADAGRIIPVTLTETNSKQFAP